MTAAIRLLAWPSSVNFLCTLPAFGYSSQVASQIGNDGLLHATIEKQVLLATSMVTATTVPALTKPSKVALAVHAFVFSHMFAS